MSATQTAKMIDILTREKPLTKTEATEFLDFVEQKVEQKQKTDGWLKVLIAGLLAGLLAVFSMLWELKREISYMELRIDARLDTLEKRFDRLERILLKKK